MQTQRYTPVNSGDWFVGASRCGKIVRSFWSVTASIIFCIFTSSAAAQYNRNPLPAYTSGTIYVFEYQKDPVTVPYDDSTTIPDATVYFGVIKNVDGSPAAGAGFYAQTLPIIQSDRPVQTVVGSQLMHADEQGRFRFALK